MTDYGIDAYGNAISEWQDYVNGFRAATFPALVRLADELGIGHATPGGSLADKEYLAQRVAEALWDTRKDRPPKRIPDDPPGFGY